MDYTLINIVVGLKYLRSDWRMQSHNQGSFVNEHWLPYQQNKTKDHEESGKHPGPVGQGPSGPPPQVLIEQIFSQTFSNTPSSCQHNTSKARIFYTIYVYFCMF